MSRNRKDRPQQVRVAHSAFARILMHRVVKAVGIIVVVLALVYVCFAGTIIRAVPSTSGTGVVMVKNNTFPGGVVPVGRVVIMDIKDAQGYELTDRLKQAFVPNSNVVKVEVLTGNYGPLTWAAPDILSVNGVPVRAPMPAVNGVSPIGTDKTNWFLKNQYVVRCISGACVPGHAYIISVNNIIGIPLTGSNPSGSDTAEHENTDTNRK